jgi:hypothetical protein
MRRRFAFALLWSCVLVACGIVSVPAKAGDYYDGGYHHHRYSSNVWYSSNCCYKKIVRHERSVRYVPTERPYYRDGYYERPRYRGSYYDRPYRSSYYSDRHYYRSGYYERPAYRSSYYYNTPRRYVSDSYAVRYAGEGYYGYAGYRDGCTRVRVLDGRGGWVWGSRCY